MRSDGGRIQVFSECGHYFGRHRTCPSDTQETILVWARSISKLWVTKANLGPSPRVAPPGSESSNLRSGPDSRPEAPISTAFNASVPLRGWGSPISGPYQRT